MATNIAALHRLGQSLWYDNIERRLIENGELAHMIQRGEMRGLTSNPSIFHNAIARSDDYDAALLPLAWAGCTTGQIYEQLVIEDIRAAADLLHEIYLSSAGEDGYVSLEVNPNLADQTEATQMEAGRLWEAVGRPNLMIKIPATLAGLPAIQASIAAGINVNVTLIFSLSRYRQVMEAYLAGLEQRLAANQPVDGIASVASFFVSRIDSKVDARLQAILRSEAAQSEQARALLGKLAVANARLAYQEFHRCFESERFTRLKARGARLQRPLWASTSTKNPAYPDTLYVDELIGRYTVNTVPPQTLVAFADHGHPRLTIEQDLEAAQAAFEDLVQLGIDFKQVTQELEAEGVKAFADAHAALLEAIEARRQSALSELGPLAGGGSKRVAKMAVDSFPQRLHQPDPTLWTDDSAGQAEIFRRMGWLELPESSRRLLPELKAFADQVRAEGYTHALLLGMGGSSLAAEMMSLVFAPGNFPDNPKSFTVKLSILDSTHPEQVRASARISPVKRTLYIVSSKSGGTAEVNAFLDFFWARARRAVGEKAGSHFVAITDPDTSLEHLAGERGFRRTFLADPNVGGRYSALTVFGLLPAALLGIDLDRLLERAGWMARQCDAGQPIERNPGLVLGAILGEATLQGKDKLTLIADPPLVSFGAWLEQLIAESSGKQGQGILPVDGEHVSMPARYGSDRLFIYLRCSGDYDRYISRFRRAGFPALTLRIPETYDLGAEIYRWEVATAVGCAVLGVNAFDQPDVQDAKTRTNDKIAAYRQSGAFLEGQPAWQDASIAVWGEIPSSVQSLAEVLARFLAQNNPGDYVALNAYLPRQVRTEALLRRLRIAIQSKTHLATTVGFGPRYLHSTGQLHKGGPGNGLFILITAESRTDLMIPGQGISFGALLRGQALGDLEALLARGRRVIRLHIKNPDQFSHLIENWE